MASQSHEPEDAMGVACPSTKSIGRDLWARARNTAKRVAGSVRARLPSRREAVTRLFEGAFAALAAFVVLGKGRPASWRSFRFGAALRKAGKALCLATFLLAFAGMATALYCLVTLPLNGGQQTDQIPSAVTFETSDGQAFATRGVYRGVRLAANEVPENLKKAIVAIEDRRFFSHFGVDLRGIVRAIFRDFWTGAPTEGASTITQQLARLTFLTPERSIRRKIQEALIALWFESHLSKDEILVRYLNSVYFGANAYGVDAAARRYFGKPAKDVSLAEAAHGSGPIS